MPVATRLNEPEAWRRGVIGAPVIGDEDVGVGRSCRRLRQLLRIGKDLDMQAGRQFGRDAAGGIGGDIAQEQRFHSPKLSPAPPRTRARFAPRTNPPSRRPPCGREYSHPRGLTLSQ